MTVAHVTHQDVGTATVARRILHALPAWFGRPEARDRYIKAAATLPMITVVGDGGVTVGFLSLKPHSADAAEIHVMGVLPTHHRLGYGTALVEAAASSTAKEGRRFLTVRTLAADHGGLRYAATRAFYAARGFSVVGTYPEMWGPEAPCQLMLRTLVPQTPRPPRRS